MNIDQAKFDQVIINFQNELAKLRTGRANPAMIEDLRVDYYGTPTPIKNLASISVPEPRQLVIQPWDKNSLQPLEKAIRESDLGLNPGNEGDKLRIIVPALTEERRKEMIKIASRLAEEARVRVRGVREEIVKEIKKDEAAGKLPEDQKFREMEKLQKTIDDYNAKVKELLENKEKEMMTV